MSFKHVLYHGETQKVHEQESGFRNKFVQVAKCLAVIAGKKCNCFAVHHKLYCIRIALPDKFAGSHMLFNFYSFRCCQSM